MLYIWFVVRILHHFCSFVNLTYVMIFTPLNCTLLHIPFSNFLLQNTSIYSFTQENHHDKCTFHLPWQHLSHSPTRQAERGPLDLIQIDRNKFRRFQETALLFACTAHLRRIQGCCFCSFLWRFCTHDKRTFHLPRQYLSQPYG